MKYSVQGFTLLEVLVTVMLLAVVSSGVMFAAQNSLRQQSALEQRTFASWIADNKITEMRASHAWADGGVNDEDISFAGRQWHVRTSFSQTSNPSIQKIEVAVWDNEKKEDAPYTLSGYLGKY